jgi:membrane protein
VLAYITVPNARVRLLPALGGAVVAAALWEIGKWGFTQYLSFSAGYARLYGSIALIPLFLLWVYITWVIVLFGLSVSYYLQHGRRLARQQRQQAALSTLEFDGEPAIVDPGAILALTVALARRFESGGRPAELGVLAADLSLSRVLTALFLERLVQAGMVHRVEPPEAPTGAGAAQGLFVLARPPEQIDAQSVLNLAEGLVCPLGNPLLPVTQCLRRARHEAVRGRSLAWFLDQGEPAAAGIPAEAGVTLPLAATVAAQLSRGEAGPKPN